MITLEELLSIKFYFHFKGSHDNDWKDHPDKMTRMEFRSDGTVDIIPNRFTEASFLNQEFVWEFAGNGNAIKINNYPPELISRNSDNWGWIAQNPYVLYASYPIPEPETDEYQHILINYLNRYQETMIHHE